MGRVHVCPFLYKMPVSIAEFSLFGRNRTLFELEECRERGDQSGVINDGIWEPAHELRRVHELFYGVQYYVPQSYWYTIAVVFLSFRERL